MRLNKKGDLALSTNAIVVLIIAVIILGLIITFITQGFEAVSGQFFEKIEALPAPPEPTRSSPISLSDVVITGAGEQMGVKVRVLNVGTGSAVDFVPEVSCGILTADADNPMRPQTIAALESATYTYYGYVSKNAEEKMYSCLVTAELPGVTKTVDFTVKVD